MTVPSNLRVSGAILDVTRDVLKYRCHGCAGLDKGPCDGCLMTLRVQAPTHYQGTIDGSWRSLTKHPQIDRRDLFAFLCGDCASKGCPICGSATCNLKKAKPCIGCEVVFYCSIPTMYEER